LIDEIIAVVKMIFRQSVYYKPIAETIQHDYIYQNRFMMFLSFSGK